MSSPAHNLVDVGVQVDFVYSNATIRNNQFADLGYDSLHSTPKQQQHQEKELQSFEVEEISENKKVNNKLSSKILEKLPKSCCQHESREEMVANKVEANETERLVWDKKMDFLLSIIGFAVDLANVWRFPYLCYKNGGGVFLIPYSLMLIFTALPLFFLELSLGQFNKSGPITLWNKVCPTMKGVGYCCVLIAWYVSFYYNVIIGWTFYYIYITLTSGSSLPWAHCENPWNTPECLAISSVMDLENKTCLNYTINENRISSAVEFYKRGVLQINEARGLEDMGSIRWPIVICVACVFVVLYFSLFKGVKSSGKVVWVTATAPYIILTILLIRGLFLPGAVDGIKYYLEPRLEELKKASVWIDAANQVFFSVGVGFGVHLTYASFNKFHNNCYNDALLTVAVNSLTSFYSGFVIFTYLGYMANGMCKKISEVAQEGYGLVFMVYPEAISTLPYSHVWALLFFVMLVTLGLDSAMGGLEAVITGLMDEFRFKKLKREQFTAIVLFASFLMSLINTTQGGGYTMYWFDVYAASVSLLCSALYEAIAISYCYGIDRFCADIKLMINYYPSNYWRICWKFMSPLCLTSIVLLTLYDAASNPLTWESYQFPLWAIILGWLFSLLPVAIVPIVFIYRFLTTRSHTPPNDASIVSKNEIIAVPLKSPVYV